MVSAADVANGLGRFLIGLGLLVLSFAGFQLWGTGLAEAQAQDQLAADFEELLSSVEADGSANMTMVGGAGGTAPEVTDEVSSISDIVPTPFVRQVRADQLPTLGQASGRIYIPALGVDKTIVHGVARDDLRLGPGHYPNTAWPGQVGNAAIAGHRTTHGAPFLNLDRLNPGDDIFVQTVQGVFQYRVEEHEDQWGHPQGHFIVGPSAVDVLDDFGDARLTLTACHPRYSAAQRLIVTAVLVSEPAPTLAVNTPAVDDAGAAGSLVGEYLEEGTADLAFADEPTDGDAGVSSDVPADADPGQAGVGSDRPGNSAAGIDQPTTVEESLGWQPQHWRPTSLWALLTSGVALLGAFAGRAWRRRPAYLLAAVPFLYCLYWTFTHLDKMLPAV